MLEQSQAVSETFIEEVSALAVRVGSDARRLITALEERQVKKFRDHKIDALEVYLIERGALDPRQVLDWEELKRQVLRETSALWPEQISVPEVVQAALGLWEMSTRLAD